MKDLTPEGSAPGDLSPTDASAAACDGNPARHTPDPVLADLDASAEAIGRARTWWESGKDLVICAQDAHEALECLRWAVGRIDAEVKERRRMERLAKMERRAARHARAEGKAP